MSTDLDPGLFEDVAMLAGASGKAVVQTLVHTRTRYSSLKKRIEGAIKEYETLEGLKARVEEMNRGLSEEGVMGEVKLAGVLLAASELANCQPWMPEQPMQLTWGMWWVAVGAAIAKRLNAAKLGSEPKWTTEMPVHAWIIRELNLNPN